MRVHLAVQVVSNSMVRLINDYAKICGGEKKYESLKLMIIKIDRLVDIMNNTDVSNRGEKKGCKMIDSPDHFHIQELLDIMVFFGKWKDEAKDKDDNYITWQCHEDLSWLIFATIGIARTYLKEDKSRRMCQRKSGTDDCEHEFAGSRLRNPKPTQGDMRKVTARRAGTRSSSAFTNLNKSNTSGDKSIYVDELIRPIRKKRKFE